MHHQATEDHPSQDTSLSAVLVRSSPQLHHFILTFKTNFALEIFYLCMSGYHDTNLYLISQECTGCHTSRSQLPIAWRLPTYVRATDTSSEWSLKTRLDRANQVNHACRLRPNRNMVSSGIFLMNWWPSSFRYNGHSVSALHIPDNQHWFLKLHSFYQTNLAPQANLKYQNQVHIQC